MVEQRLERLREILDEKGLDGVVITQPENRRYLSGFTGSAGVLVITQERAWLITDFRYFEQVKQQSPAFELVEIAANSREVKVLADQIGALGLRRVGFESHAVSVEAFDQWKQAMPDVSWIATGTLVEGLRRIKEEAEIQAIAEAVRIADEAMIHVMEWIRPGMMEREIAWELEVYMRTHGASALSFTTIVASGPNAALPHAVTSERPVQIGDPVVIDMGAVYQGYCSDLTRSFCVGEASTDYLMVWNVVLKAQMAAEAQIKAGMTGVEADAIARDIIYAAGYEGKFGHGLGHGVGLAIHEEPRASQMAKDVLPIGAVLTVEPGIYLPDWGGVRIEDMVVIAEDGCQILTQAPKVPVVQAK